MTAKALAAKAGKVLGMLLAQRVLGNRPITLVGYSLGSLVIFAALEHLATVPPSETASLVQDVFLLDSPVPVQASQWASARRVVAGRLVNGYSKRDYVLAVLARLSGGTWGVAGLQPVGVEGVENVECAEVDGHLRWKALLGRELLRCAAPGVDEAQVKQDAPDEDAESVDAAETPMSSAPELSAKGGEGKGVGEDRSSSPESWKSKWRPRLRSLRSSSSYDSQHRTLSAKRTL